ncbi:MAG: hypothetical protein COS19_12690 [Flavobacteriaceae bacterium CG02_land_8_20_14_3_00_34_13]|nr:MAG: hypothetical protein COS19_12690 [Flavobacteriaceae bacterium CG02_land_8_20_14_3_00_34_13]PIZ07391.1 MAG: hypothetical protein COY56_09275 [Flavobacteriaceae bacterium CG_4_10_14_0_8_um_filter_34_31]PJC06838.1 MAG: hypothetical protein CO068_09165 [Flavobacteriaceae bacterium CG_4_9_14_0_8_um_filter_34_30]
MNLNNEIVSIVVILIFAISCQPSFHDQYYKKIQSSWRISDFQHKDYSEDKIIDLREQAGFFLMGLENNNHIYFLKRENREDVSVRATYEIFKENDSIKMRIEKSDDKRIEGIYDFYIDTIGERDAAYLLQVSLDSEKTYLSALKWKDK